MIITTLGQIRNHSPCSRGWRQLTEAMGEGFPVDKPFLLSHTFVTNGASDFLWAVSHLHPRLATAYALYLVKGLPKVSENWARTLRDAEDFFRENDRPFTFYRHPRLTQSDMWIHWACRMVESYTGCDIYNVDRTHLTEELDSIFGSQSDRCGQPEAEKLMPLLDILNSDALNYVDIVSESDILSLLDMKE